MNHIYKRYNAITKNNTIDDYILKYETDNHVSYEFFTKMGHVDDIRILHWISYVKFINNPLPLTHRLIESQIINTVKEKQEKTHLIITSLKLYFHKKRQKTQDAVIQIIILHKTGKQIL